MKELYRKYRPKKFEDVIGQEDAVKTLTKKFEKHTVPHAILFHGPFGTGKTTLARIVAKELKCSNVDFVEKNTADYRGIDDVREIRAVMNQAPMDGDVKIWLLDEIHKATNDGQNAMLKLLEDPPDHVYFFLATTDPEKLLQGIKQRCLSIKLNPIKNPALLKILQNICKKESIKIDEEVLEKIVEYSGGSARDAIQILDKVYLLDDTKEQLTSITKASVRTASIEIARKLINTKTKWRDIAPILKELENEDPETIRWMILGYGKSVLLNKENTRAYRMIQAFRDNFYDCKGAGIVASCWEVING